MERYFMKKFVFVSLIFLLNCVNGYAQTTFRTYHPVYYPNNYSRYDSQYYQDFDDINALENYTFNRKYVRDNNLARLQRLEMQTFGAVQQGDFNTRYQNVRSAILVRPKQNYRKSFLRNMGDYFSGQLTGFTPSVNPYPNVQTYTNPYERQRQSYYYTPFGNGYRVNNYGSGSGTSVKILD